MSVAHIGSISGYGTSSALDTTGANFLVVEMITSGSAPTDSKGNTWTALTNYGDLPGVSIAARLFYCVNPTVGAGHTFTNPLTYGHIAASGFSGVAVTSVVGGQDGNYSSSTGASMIVVGSVTPATSGDLVVVGFSLGNTTGSPAVSGLTIGASTNGLSGTNYGGGIAYLITSSTSAVSPTLSYNPANPSAAAMAVFKAAAAGPFAPVLSFPVGVATNTTTATVGATTNTPAGTVYYVVTTSTTQPSVAQIKAGFNDGGTSAAASGSQSISTSGALTFGATGLTTGTTYYAHLVHNASSLDSNRVSSGSFVPATPPSAPVVTAATTTVTGQQVVVAGTYTGTATSGLCSIATASTANGAVAQGPATVAASAGAFTATFGAVPTGSYAAPAISLTGSGGTGTGSASAFEILAIGGVPTAPSVDMVPAISVQPAPVSVVAPAAATFTVTAAGGNLVYVWKRASVPIPGAPSAPSFTLTPTVIGDTASEFSVTISNSAGSITSNTATLTVTAAAVAPAISQQPSAVSVSAGAVATFTSAATGSPSPTPQWQRSADGITWVNINGATSGTYSITTSLTDNDARLRCVWTNGTGSATTVAVVLTVTSGGTFAVQFGPGHYSTGGGPQASVSARCSVWVGSDVLDIGASLGPPTFEQTVISDSAGVWTLTGIATAGPVLILARNAAGTAVYLTTKTAG